jgi:PAS domain S-box-containing protein
MNILEALPGALFVVDDDVTIVYANASAQAMTGATSEVLCGNSFWRGAPQLVSTALYQAVRKTKQTRALTEVQYASPATNIWLHVHLAPTVGGVMLQFHEAREPARRQEMFSHGERLSIDDLDGLHARIGILTPEGIVLEINEVLLDDAQVPREEVIGKPLAETPWWPCSPVSQEQLCAAIARASAGETVHFESLLCPSEGPFLSFEGAITPHMDADQRIEYLVIAGIDITASKQAEADIHAMIDAIPHFVWMMSPDGSCEYGNQQWCDYTNMTAGQLQGDGWIQCVHPDDRQMVHEAWLGAVHTGTQYEVECRVQHGHTGDYRWFLTRVLPYQDAQGTILHWIGTCTDIEDQRRADQQLKTSEQNWRVLAETLPHLVWTTQPDGRIDYINQRYCDWTQADFEHIRDYGWRQFLHPDDRERTLALRQRSIETGERYESEHRLKNSQTGEYRWLLARAYPVRDDTGQIVKWIGTSTDIEDKKQVEQQLKTSEQNWRVLAETVPQFVWIGQPGGLKEYYNQRWLDYAHATFEQLQGDGWRHFLHPDDYERTLALGLHSRETGEPYESENRLKDGRTGIYRWFLTRGVPVRDDTGQIVKWFGTCTDIEDQKQTEEALRQNQAQVQTLMASNVIGIYVTKKEGIVEANDTFLRMTGYSRDDLQHGRLNCMHMTAPEYIAITEKSREQMAILEYMTPYEKEYIRKDGSRLPVLIGGAMIQLDPLQKMYFILDNSARKALEQRKDDFISMASHELRNPLAALKMQAQLVRKRLERQSHHEAAAALSKVEGPIRQLERLIGELLDVSKIQAGRLDYIQEPVDLEALLHEVAETMQQISTTHAVVMRGTAPQTLIGDKGRLEQVFTNLISNAIKYSPDAETVEMDLSASPEMVTIRVHDHGLGIPQEQRDKIFERFYRVTGPKQKVTPGLGMGLYIVAEIVQRHGGTMTVESAVGKGSTFTVTLPLTRDSPA